MNEFLETGLFGVMVGFVSGVFTILIQRLACGTHKVRQKGYSYHTKRTKLKSDAKMVLSDMEEHAQNDFH